MSHPDLLAHTVDSTTDAGSPDSHGVQFQCFQRILLVCLNILLSCSFALLRLRFGHCLQDAFCEFRYL